MNKYKAILLVMISAFIGIVSNPEMLAASDSVAVSGINTAGVVQTVVLPEEEPETSEPEVSETFGGYDFSYITNVPSYEYVAPEPVYVAPTNYISFNGNVVELSYTSNTYEDAGLAKLAWYYSSGQFIYAHNLDYVFAGLYNLGVGSNFTVSYGGSVNTYTVAKIVIFDRIDGYTLRSTETGKETTMYPIVNGYYNGVGYNMALMTCYGPNSSQRYVIYAN